jgi:hypothetical protein
MQYVFSRTAADAGGPASQVKFIFTRSGPDDASDIQFHMQPLSADKPGAKGRNKFGLHLLGLPAPTEAVAT